MTLDLNDPLVSAAIVRAVDRRVDQKLATLPSRRYGVVQAVDTVNRRASVFLSGDTAPSPGFRYSVGQRLAVGDLIRVVISGADRYVEDVINGTGPVFAPVTTAMLAATALRMRYVSVAPTFIVNAATTTADVPATDVELTNLPTSGVAVVALMFMVRTSDTSQAAMAMLNFSGSEAMTGYSSGVASRGGSNYALVVPGGTNGRQVKYSVDWASGTVSYWIRPVGYFTLVD